MSYTPKESGPHGLFTNQPDDVNSSTYYKDRHHIRWLFRKLTLPFLAFLIPTILIVSIDNIVRILGVYIDTQDNGLASVMRTMRATAEGRLSTVGDFSWILPTFYGMLTVFIVFFVIKAFHDFAHSSQSISKMYVTDASKLLLQKEESRTIKTRTVTGASVKRTIVDKCFPHCGSVIVQTIDFNGESDEIKLIDVRMPYRMRDVILNVMSANLTP